LVNTSTKGFYKGYYWERTLYLLSYILPIFHQIILWFSGRLQIFDLITLITCIDLHLHYDIDTQMIIRTKMRSISLIWSDQRIHNKIFNRFQLNSFLIDYFNQHSNWYFYSFCMASAFKIRKGQYLRIHCKQKRQIISKVLNMFTYLYYIFIIIYKARFIITP